MICQCVCLLCILFATLLADAARNPKVRSRAGEGAASQNGPSAANVNHAIDLAVGYMNRACDPNGRFAYRIDIASGQLIPSYNIVRHAGAVYALAMANGSHPDQRTSDTILRAARFMRLNYIGPGVRPEQLTVWSKPLAQHSDAELGATALGLVALAEARKLDPKSVSLEQLQALGRFVLFSQRPDGSFVQKYNADKKPMAKWSSPYYPGEAALGFIALYAADHSRVWLAAAAKSLSYLATKRSGISAAPNDHWALIATARLLPYCRKSECGTSYHALVRHAIQICKAILREQLESSSEASDGAFDAAGRTAPTATRMEGLLATLEFLPDEYGGLRREIQAAIGRGIAFLIRAQIASGPAAGGLPGALASGVPGASEVRIDYLQHTLCAWLRYELLIHNSVQS